MNPLLEILLGAAARFIQGFIAATPTFLVGLFIAAVLHYYFGDKGTKKLFGGETLKSLPQSWLIGMLLPVCSIGVLPVLIQMKRAGLKPGAMSAFALSAPLFNPLSLLYGLTLSRPLVIILFACGSLLIVTLLGLLWDKVARAGEESERTSRDKPESLIGLSRLTAMFLRIAKDSTGTPMILMLVALLGPAILALLLDYGAMQKSVESDDIMAPIKMLVVAIPIYATPMLAMSQLGMMFQHANSPGAAFNLLILGAGINLATPLWFGASFGWKKCGIWMSFLLAIVIVCAYGVNEPLIPVGVTPAGHTHAFDIYTNPIPAQSTHPFSMATEVLENQFDLVGQIVIGILSFLMLTGVISRLLAIDETSLSRVPKSSEGKPPERQFDLIVPPKVVGATMLVGLVALSVVACYAYYPSTDECLEEISLARAECLTAANSGDYEHALFWLPIWEEWSRKMEVGTFLRRGELRQYQSMQGYLIRKKLELLEHELEHDPPAPSHVKAAVRSIFDTNRRWVASFRQKS